MTRQIIITLSALFALTACVTPFSYEGDARQGYMHVDTYPQGATLSFPDGTNCTTPCRVLVPEPINMVIGKAGYKAVTTTLVRSQKGRAAYTLELSAPTTNVEESSLPEL